MALAFLLVLYTYLGFAAALSKEGWRSQSIYQLLTDRYARTDGSTAPCADLGDYCGGSWQGITNNLDYIQSMGFTAIWISPITENIPVITYEGAAYHGFWPQQINQINSNFGTAADLKALSNAVHERGMYLMVDMVTNDMAWNGNYTTVDYSVYDVFDDSSYYHPYCPITDYQNSTNAVECWSGDQHISLPDLATENSVVVDKWQAWVSNITSFYGIDGIRLDACLEQNKPFFTSFESAAGVYIICEAYDYPIDVVCDYQNYVSGLLNFPMWYLVIDAFGSISGSITNLYNGITEIQGNCTDVSLLGNFVENHDVNRFPYTVTDIGLDQNAIAFVMLNDGIPIIYAGEEQYYSGGPPPADRETTWTSNYNTTTIYYQLIKKINAMRTCVIAKDSTYTTTKSVPFYLDSQVLGVKKGASPTMQIVGVFNNRGTGAEAYTINMTETGWTAGQVIYEIYTQQSVTVTPEGYLPVYMYGGQPRMYFLLSSYQCCSGIGGNGASGVAGVANLCLSTSSSTSTKITSIVPSTSAIVSSSTAVSSSSTSLIVLPSSTPIVLSTSSTTTSSTTLSSSTPIAPSTSSTAISSTQLSSSTSASPIVLPTSSTAISSTVLSSSTSIVLSSTSSTAFSSTVLSSSTPTVLSTSSTAISSTVAPSSSPGSSSSSALLPSSTPIVPSTSSTVTSSSLASSSSAVLPSSTTSSAEASVIPASSTQSSSPGTSTSNPTSGVPSLSSSSGSSSALPASTAPTSSGVAIPTTSSASTASNVPESVSSSAAPAPATAAPICPSADGNTFIANGQEFVVGCAIDSDQEYFTQMSGTDIADCVHICTTYAGTKVCAAVTYSDGICYLKSSPGAVYNQNSSDSAFVISTPNGPETVASGYLAGNISQAAPTCPLANGNTFEIDGYVYVVACNIDTYVVDISTAPGADLATCVESCVSFSGTTSCVAVTLNNGTCHFKGSVGTVYHASGVDTAFIIADNSNPTAPPSGNLSLPSNPTGNPIPPSNPVGHPSLPPNATGTYTIVSGTEVIVYEPDLTYDCP